ncbi:hypothetical protein ACFVX3_19570 [Rhodococcus erythropolis]
MESVDPTLVGIALNRASGPDFEDFANDFMAATTGYSFRPLGGTKDGGADGFEDCLYERTGRTTIFYQASIEKDAEAKIKKTVNRLKEFGRDPRILYYLTSCEVKYLDQVEDDLSGEFEIGIRIRDAKYISTHINSNPQTVAAFNYRLRHLTDFLKSAGASPLIGSSEFVKNPEIYVFLSQEMERREGLGSTLDGVVDSLVLWSLQGTDPDRNILFSEAQISEKIEDALPAVKTIVQPKIRPRLDSLTAGSKEERKVRWHKKEDKFCLPWESRRFIESDNAEDEKIRREMSDSVAERIVEFGSDLTVRQKELSKKLIEKTIQSIFEREGLIFASQLENGDGALRLKTVSDTLRDSLYSTPEVRSNEREAIIECSFKSLRGVFSESTEAERTYLGRLTRTYSLLFTLNRQPKLLEYFERAAGDYYLYVGADQIILALSERFLPYADRVVTNTLEAASKVGAKLILTEHVVQEVVHNLRISDREYQNSFSMLSIPVPYDVARNCPRILVRAFLYANLERGRLGSEWPRNWANFVSKFCTHGLLHKVQAFEFVRRSLQGRFQMEYRSTEELLNLVEKQDLEELTASLLGAKDDMYELARNDALMALAVYGHRKKYREDSTGFEFGYKTWWLTNETRILRETRELVNSNRGARYVMRPEFLLNFLTLSPAAAVVREEFGSIFPSHLGMSLSRKMPEESYRDLLVKVQDSAEMDEATRSAAMAYAADRMRGDFLKQYDPGYSRSLDDVAEEMLG